MTYRNGDYIPQPVIDAYDYGKGKFDGSLGRLRKSLDEAKKWTSPDDQIQDVAGILWNALGLGFAPVQGVMHGAIAEPLERYLGVPSEYTNLVTDWAWGFPFKRSLQGIEDAKFVFPTLGKELLSWRHPKQRFKELWEEYLNEERIKSGRK